MQLEYTRRLPIYLLLDCSESMVGERIQSVKNATRELHNELMGNPDALESVYISVITFNSEQIEVFSLKDLAEFKPPKLKVSGTSALGAALELVASRAENELKKTTVEWRGDEKPLVFIMSAFEPTDDWKKSLAKFQLYKWRQVVGCAVDGADPGVLRQIAGESVVDLNTEGVRFTESLIDILNGKVATLEYLRLVEDEVGFDNGEP